MAPVVAESPFSRDAVIRALFSFLQREQVEYVVLGDDDRDVGDIDLAVSERTLFQIPRLLVRFAISIDGRLVQSIRHEPTAFFFVLAWQDENDRVAMLELDVCSDYYRSGRKYLTAGFLLKERTAVVAPDGYSHFVPSPEASFLYYVIKKIEKQELDLAHGETLTEYWRASSVDLRQHLKGFWSNECAKVISSSAASGNWEPVRAMLPGLVAVLHRKVPRRLSVRWAEVRRLADRVLRPTGLFVAILGPDGSGKSTVNKELRRQLGGAFWGTDYFHLRPTIENRHDHEKGKTVSDPHAEKPRSWLGSILKILFYWFDYTFGYLGIVRPKLLRSRLVVFDRYYHDVLIDPKRYRYAGPLGLARFIGRVVPCPDYFVFLDAPATVVQSRKAEVTMEETQRQLDAYRDIAYELPKSLLVDASKPVDEVVTDTVWAVLDQMGRRVEKRFWLR